MSAVVTDYKGDCFLAAPSTAQGAIEAGADRVLVVHGLPLGTGGLVKGKRHWHAWAEVLTVDTGWVVADMSNGKNLVCPRQDFYRAARLTNRLVWRYSLDDVLRNVARDGTAGPWVPGWETMGL